ncbi:MAG: EAL domain-containing protein, partial [Solobacterium sp.]|nr:EAL domain-containing protein [Solobacterium sp.]
PFGSAIMSGEGKSTIVSENLLQTPFMLVTAGTRQLPPLNELRIGMLKSLAGVAETVKQLYPGIEIFMFDTMDECVRALREGRVDALLHNSYVWSYVLQKPSYDDLTLQPESMFSMDFRAGTLDTQEGRETIARLNRGIAVMTDTQRQAVILDYTSRRLYRYDLSDYLYQYWEILFGMAVLLALLTVLTVHRRKAIRRRQEEAVRQLIDQDALTGVLSVRGFRDQVKHLLKTNPDIPYLLSYSNIRNFKYINDSLGRDAGDDLLKFWADHIRRNLSDKEAVGRVSGDHFAVLHTVEGEDKIHDDEQKVVEPVRNYFIDRGKENRVQLCTGIYVLTQEDYRARNVDHMLDCAKVAEERVRETRRNGYEFYNPEQWEKGKRVADVVSWLPTAIATGELQVWYQPQVDYGSGMIIGAEALCRWSHKTLGMLSPSEFIPILEEAGMISDLDSYVWETVCKDLKRWNEAGLQLPVSVNMSREDIRSDNDVSGQFRNLIRTYGLSADQIRVEITETAYVNDPDALIRTTLQLQESGFQVEMDDFGSGNSSLHMLKEVPVDRIKMDLHFLSGTGDLRKGCIIVSYMVQMVNALGMKLIAEGVETEEQARFLYDHGCNEMQGYFFSKAVPVSEFEALLKTRRMQNTEASG